MRFSQNVNTYIQTQPKQEMFEVDLKKDSIAIIILFLFVATLTHTYIQTQPEQKLFEADFKADSIAIVCFFFCNVNTCTQISAFRLSC